MSRIFRLVIGRGRRRSAAAHGAGPAAENWSRRRSDLRTVTSARRSGRGAWG